MEIRSATLDDVPNLCALLKLLFEQEDEFSANYLHQESGLKLILENPFYGQIIVGCVEGEIVGMANLLYTVSTFMGKKVAILEDMVVSPEHRREGFGDLILNAAILPRGFAFGCVCVLKTGERKTISGRSFCT